jgi:hypothetical protein
LIFGENGNFVFFVAKISRLKRRLSNSVSRSGRCGWLFYATSMAHWYYLSAPVALLAPHFDKRNFIKVVV